ncbi:MAG: serine hydrolase [Reichenbachiella sp.]|uniref:serine hydrolase domain-containing protein n=1 Tax=Reichenbachiella sp. TaxID=2184521 RepID=UPI003265ED82
MINFTMIPTRILLSCIVLFYCQSGIMAQNVTDNSTTRSDTLHYSSPGEVGLDSILLHVGIDSIINQALDSGAFPGCQILLAKEGKVFYHKSFGYHTYDSLRPVLPTDIYDIASITKIAATTLALMKLYDEGKFDPDQSLGHYFPFLARSNKGHLTMRMILAHQSGLKNWIPYHAESRKKNGRYRRKTIAADSSESYPYRIPGSSLWMHKDYVQKKIYRMIKKSSLYEEQSYVYSGLVFYLLPELVERLSGSSFQDYLSENFYQPLESQTMGFEPLKKFPASRIVPTEIDTFFRMNLLHGVVHDEGAALMLGVSGNAGLFSNAYDLAKVFQLLIDSGSYGGKSYLRPETILEFTRCQYCALDNRRGMGFDKPLIKYDSIKTSVAKLASPESFGHSGYTGTLVWADPDNKLIFVFLANRVYPTRTNRKIYELNIRPRIHDLVYNLIKEEKISE